MCEAKPGPRCTPHAATAYQSGLLGWVNEGGVSLATEPSPLDRVAQLGIPSQLTWDRLGHAHTSDGYEITVGDNGCGRLQTVITAPDGSGVLTVHHDALGNVESTAAAAIQAHRNVTQRPSDAPSQEALSWPDETTGQTVYSIDHPDVQDGKIVDTIHSDGVQFHRRRDGVHPDFPYAMRFQANRPLSDDEIRTFAGLVGYKYRSTVAGEPLGDPLRDSQFSFIVGADTTKTARDDIGLALEDFERDLPEFVRDGSPIRKTDRAGLGTKGTRLIDGINDPDLTFELYYDNVITSTEASDV